MKLYSKQLNSVEELKREKHVLRYAVKHSDEALSFGEIGSKKSSTDDAASAGILGTMISALGSKSLFNTILAIVPPIISLVAKRSGKKKKNPVESMVKEVISGYIKWKLVHMGYKTIMGFMGSKKNKKQDHGTKS
jgi:hypothetical protein